MKNNQLLPFERNRYYAGKVLTSTDFMAEQQYMNNKRRFINNLMFGSGVVCGLSVFNLDDLSILVESGVAMDQQGREIVIEKSVVHRLSSIEGFEQLKGKEAVLYIRYKEEDVHPIYCAQAADSGEEYQCNRINEGYELFLMDKASLESQFVLGDEFLLEEVLADTPDYTVILRMPSIVSRGKTVKLILKVQKNSAEEKKLSLQGVLQIPALTTEEGRHELTLALSDIFLKSGEQYEKEYWLKAEQNSLEESNLISQKDSMKLVIGDENIPIKSDINLKIVFSDSTPAEIAAREIGKLNLEMRGMGPVQQGVPLAEFTLIRTDVAYLIERVLDKEVKNYILTPAQVNHRTEYMAYFREPERDFGLRQSLEAVNQPDPETSGVRGPSRMASGTVEIPLKNNMKKGDVCFSEEIMHGLGKGNVYVDIGISCLEEDVKLKNTTRSTIYGTQGLFTGEELMNVQTAVKVFHEKGSFQIAAKLLGEQKSIVLLVNWVAVKFVSLQENHTLEDTENMRIVPLTPTVRMGAKESYFFDVQFEHMKPCALSYELTENGSGEVTGAGVYTAPGKEGVYELHIYCTDKPQIGTYVYAIVSK